MKITITILLILLYLIIALLATKSIAKSGSTDRQRTFQFLISWLIPFIGGFICILFNKKEKAIGSHLDKRESWTRLVKYDEHNEA